MNDETKSVLVYVGVLAVVGLIVAVAWIVSSACEASAFERMTGKPASTWDAMFLELRVHEPAKGGESCEKP